MKASASVSDILRLYREQPVAFVRNVFQVEPDSWQEDVLEAFPRHQLIAMLACKGPGKAIRKDEVIQTPSGPREFGSLRVGDLVFAADGSPTSVIGVYDRGVRKVYRMIFDDGSSAVSCGEHLWKVRGRTERRHGPWAVLSTEEIIARGVREKNGRWEGRHFEIPRQGPAQFPTANLPFDPYVIGVWLGDGCRNSGQYATKPTDEIKQEIERRGLVSRAYETSNVVCVRGLATALRGLGILDKYCYEKSIPEIYKYADIEQRRDLLCGLMDTDGEIADDSHMGYSSTSERLIEDVIWLVRSLGGIAYRKKTKNPFYYDKQRKRVHGRPCHRITINLPFNPFRVPHRAERWKDPARSPSTIRYMTRRIDRIEEAGLADCMCIQVEHPDSLFLINDFIVTHNTTVLAWLIWNFILTRPHCNIALTSVSEDNARDGIWKELSKWHARSPMLQQLFEIQKRRIVSREHPLTWWCSLRTWSKSADSNAQADSLAGLHADYMMFVIDESGSIPDAVAVAAEAALATGKEVRFIQAGNPTRREGPLYRAAVLDRAKWFVIEITGDPDDPKRSPRVDATWARDQIEKYGRDNPWVKTNILGQFPDSSLNSLIGPEDIRAAMGRSYQESQIAHAAKILGVDVARFGDDASVIFPRQGLVAFRPLQYRGLDTQAGIGVVAHRWNGNWSDRDGVPKGWKPDAVFIDSTGGYGAGWIDGLRALGFGPLGVEFAGKPNDGRFFNKRAEMYWLMCEWIKEGGQLPNQPELIGELSETQYTFKGDKMLLEDKQQVKARLGRSPDFADALAETFAQPVSIRSAARRGNFKSTYDPYASIFASDSPRRGR